MTYKELCDEIYALGFESEVDSEKLLLYAVRRAQRMIFTEIPVYRSLTLFKHGAIPVIKRDIIIHKGGETVEVSYNARSYSFKTSGDGSFKISEGEECVIIGFSGNEREHKGFLHGEGKIEFIGEHSYTVYDLEIFDELFGGEISDIPTLSGYTEYEMKEQDRDFLSFTSEPTDKNGDGIKGATAYGSVIRVPSAYSGRICVSYKIAPPDISGAPDETVVLPDGCEHLPALLAASFVWLDDDSDKAEYYMSLYREAASAVRYYNRRRLDLSYKSVNGWA